jgi:hypothetical protein
VGEDDGEEKFRGPEIIQRKQGFSARSSSSRGAQEDSQLLLSAENWTRSVLKI